MKRDKWLEDVLKTSDEIHHPKLKFALTTIEIDMRKLYDRMITMPEEHARGGMTNKLRRLGEQAYEAGRQYANQFLPHRKHASLVNWDYRQDMDKLFTHLGAKPNKWLRDQIHEAIKFGDGPPVERIAHKLGYDQAKAVARTVMMNVYVKSALRRWEAEGIEKVKRIEFNDHKTCAVCKALNGKEYNIEQLVDIENPLTRDSHPNCRGSFVPIINPDTYSPLGDKIPDKVDISYDGNEAKNVPIGYRPWINNLIRKEEGMPTLVFDDKLDAAYSDDGDTIKINPTAIQDEDPREIYHEVMARRKWPQIAKIFEEQYIPKLLEGGVRAEKSFDSPEELFIENYKSFKLGNMPEDVYTPLWFYENNVI